LQDIYDNLSNFVELSSEHWKTTKYGGRPAYQHTVRSYISNMCQSGLLLRISRGCYKVIQYGVADDQE